MGETNKNKFSFKSMWRIIIIFIFVFENFNFISFEGNDYPILWTLFYMLISLGIFVFLHHKKEIIESKILIFKQSFITDFFKRIK